jgi:zinc transport system substrate-binding protein
MRDWYRSGGFAALGFAALLTGCGEQRQSETVGSVEREDDGKLSVYVVNYPLQYFAQRIGGDWVQVEFPAPADVDPAYWSPNADIVSAYQSADLILLNGAGYAKWVSTATLPTSRLVDTSVEFADLLITVADALTHSHGPEGDHSHGDVAFTTWLDPTLALDQAHAIREALAEALPQGEEEFHQRFDSLADDLLALDESLRNLFAEVGDRPLLASHPVYQYMARHYQLNLASVHFEPDERPSENAWWDLRSLLADHPADWMLWEDEPMSETSTALAALGVRSVVFDPCENTPDDGDYLTVMRENVSNLLEAFGN